MTAAMAAAVGAVSWEPLRVGGLYRHMARRDADLWERWLARHALEWEAVAYDVALGGIEPTTPGVSEQDVQMWRYLTAMKVDALLRRAGEYTLVEVRPEASVSALGAAVCYRLLLGRDHPDLVPVSAVVLTEAASADLRYCAAELDITIWTA